jgi:hypothetical protein
MVCLFLPILCETYLYRAVSLCLSLSHFLLTLSFTQITAAIAARTVDALSVALSAAAPFVATPAVGKLVDRGNALKYVLFVYSLETK